MFPFDKARVSDESYLYSPAAVWSSVTLLFWNLILCEDTVTILKGLKDFRYKFRCYYDRRFLKQCAFGTQTAASNKISLSM